MEPQPSLHSFSLSSTYTGNLLVFDLATAANDDYDDFLISLQSQHLNDGLGFTGLDNTELSPIALCSPSLSESKHPDHTFNAQRSTKPSAKVEAVKAETFEEPFRSSHASQRSPSAEDEKNRGFEPSVVFTDYDDTIEALDRERRALYDEDFDPEVFVQSPGSDSSSINNTPPPITPPNHLSATIPLPAHLLNSTKDSDSLQSDDAADCTSAESSGRPSGVTTSTNTDGHATRTGYATPPIMQNSSSLDRGEVPPSPGATRTHRHSHTRHSPYPIDRVQRGDRADRTHYRLRSISPHTTSSVAPTGEEPPFQMTNSLNLPRNTVSGHPGRLRSAKWSPPNSSREGSVSPAEDATQSSQTIMPRLIRPPPGYGSSSHVRSSSAPHHLPPLQLQDYPNSRYYNSPPTHDRSVSHPSAYSSYPNRGEFPVSSERGPAGDPPSPNSAHAYPPLSSSSRASSSRSYQHARGHSPYSASTEYSYSNPHYPGGGVNSYRVDYRDRDHKGKRPAREYDDRSDSDSGSENDEEGREYSAYAHGPYSGHRPSPPSSRTSSTSRFRVTPPNMSHLAMGGSNSVFPAGSNPTPHHIPNGIPLLLSAASTAAGPNGRRGKKHKLMQGEMEIPPPPKPTATPTPAFAKKKKSNTGRVKVEESVLDGQRRFLCPLYHLGTCQQTFSRRNDAYRHLDSCHRDLTIQTVDDGDPPPPGVIGPDRCGCGQLLSRLDALNRHYKTCKWRKEQGLPPPAPSSSQAGKRRAKGKTTSPKRMTSAKKKSGSTSSKGKNSNAGSDEEEEEWEEDELESEEEEDQLMED